ncbi:hypothetical protein CB1_000590071 [Camelus ferus]|nr:hypothetical protein CB1_000590071 [Camelus ferus]
MPIIDNVFSLAPYRDYLDEEVALDLTEDASGIGNTVSGVSGVGDTVSDLEGLKKIVTEAPELPGVPVTSEATPRTNFHSSVAFMTARLPV